MKSKRNELQLQEGGKEWIHFGLDILGLIPGLGEPFDATNAALYASEGDWINAALSLISVIPEIGDIFGKGGKIAIFLEKMITKGGRSGKLAQKVFTHGPEILSKVEKAAKLLKDNKQNINTFLDHVGNMDNEKIQKYVAPHISSVKQALVKIERSFDTINQMKQKTSKTINVNSKEPDVSKQEATKIIQDTNRQLVNEYRLKAIVSEQVNMAIKSKRKTYQLT